MLLIYVLSLLTVFHFCGISLVAIYSIFTRKKFHPRRLFVDSPWLYSVSSACLIFPSIFLVFLAVNDFKIVVNITLFFAATLLICGVLLFVFNNACRIKLKELLICVIFLTTLVTFPFITHLVPPDVDALMPGYIAFLLKNGNAPEQLYFWGQNFSAHRFIPAVGLETVVAVFSEIFGMGIEASLLVIASLTVVLMLLVFYEIIKILTAELDLPNDLSSLAFTLLAFNASFIWIYGDGAYLRLIPMLLSTTIFLVAVKAPRSALVAILIGVLHGALLYFHYRYFIWNSMVLFIWFSWQLFETEKKVKLLQFLALMFIASLAAALIIISKNVDLLIDGLPQGSIFEEKHNLSTEQAFGYWSRFQGFLLHALALVGVWQYFLYQRATQKSVLCDFAGVYYLVFLLLCWDSFITTVMPFTYYLIYSQTAILSDFSIPKIIFGFIGISYLSKMICQTSFTGNQKRAGLFVLITVVIGITCYEYSTQPFRLRSVLQINCINFLYAGLAILISFLLAFSKKVNKTNTTVLLTCLVVANEFAHAKFNYPYINQAEYQAYNWLKHNTSKHDTLILNHSRNDLEKTVEIKNATVSIGGNVKDLRAFQDFATLWTPIISERNSIFHHINSLKKNSSSVVAESSNVPDLERLDYVYWRPNEVKSCSVMRHFGVTHVVYSYWTLRFLRDQIAQSLCLEEVFSSKISIDRYGNDWQRVTRGESVSAVYAVK